MPKAVQQNAAPNMALHGQSSSIVRMRFKNVRLLRSVTVVE
jgi:hypothetical protein